MDKLLYEFLTNSNIHHLAVEHAKEKGMRLSDLNTFSQPQTWELLTSLIENGKYHTKPSEIKYIDKNTGKYIQYEEAIKRNMKDVREIWVMETLDRVVWNTIYKILYNRFEYLIDESCVSYKKSVSTRKIVRGLADVLEPNHIVVKGDLSKFFDSVPIEVIDSQIDKLEEIEPSVIWDLLREVYHDNRVYVNGELIERYGSLKQGFAIAALFADLILSDIDKEMHNYDVKYLRYSDDFIIFGNQWREAFEVFKKMLKEKGLKLNDKKTEYKKGNGWITFLGYRVKANNITVSEKTLRKIRIKIKAETINKCSKLKRPLTKRELQKVIDNIQYYFFVGCDKHPSGMGAYLYGADVMEHDIDRLDEYIKDCLRACLTNRCEIYGLGCSYGKYGIVDFNKGKNVEMNRIKVSNKDLANLGWYSLNHMRKKYLQGKDVYQAEIQQMRNGIIVEKGE